jgi:ribose transport system ATP-binding protein
MAVNAIPLIRTSGLTKRYPGVVALDGVDFTLEPGEVHVLFGENGAGKSTLISILAGATAPTAGTVELNGTPVTEFSVRHARGLGISAVFQEFSLVPSMTVTENLVLGGEPGLGPLLNPREERRRARALFEELEFEIALNRRVAELSRGEQQMVEIAKALRDDIRVLILDEPTASLTDRETEHLFGLLDRLKRRGIGLVYISHRVHEFDRIADRITVLRDGRICGTVPGKGTSERELLALMTGREVGTIYPQIRREPGPALLEVEGLAAAGVDGVSFQVCPGEVAGFAGLVGSGKSRVWRAILGLNRIEAGTVRLHGRDLTGLPTKRVIRAGVHYLPPDRKTEGLMLTASAADNLLLGMRSAGARTAGSRIAEVLQSIAKRVGLDPAALKRRVAQLSGGNQQKVLFGKGFGQEFELYVLDEPTVGIDMATRAQLYQVIRTLAESGKAVVLISSDLTEVVNLSHRLFVFSGGRVSACLTGPEITEAAVLGHFFATQGR